MRFLILLSLAVLLGACSGIQKDEYSQVHVDHDYSYFIDTETYSCRFYDGKHPPPPGLEPIHLFDSFVARSAFKPYKVYASLTVLPDPVVIRGEEFDLFRFKAWDNVYGDWVNRKELQLVHPYPRACYFYLELQSDTANAMIHIGYNANGKFYSYYEVYVDDALYEREMKLDTAKARGYVRGNVYVKYKRQVLDSKKARLEGSN